MNCKPCVARLQLVLILAGSVRRTCVRSQCTDAVNDGQEPSQDRLKILVFNDAWIETQILADHCPNWLQILLGGHFETTLRNVDLADTLENVACRRNGFPRTPLNIGERTCELVFESRRVKFLNEIFQGSRGSTQSASYCTAFDVLEIAPR